MELLGGSYWDPFLQQQGYFGNLPKNLVISGNDGEPLWQLSYEANANGYPTKITGKDKKDCSYDADMAIIEDLDL